MSQQCSVCLLAMGLMFLLCKLSLLLGNRLLHQLVKMSLKTVIALKRILLLRNINVLEGNV
ncbi:hypothetical protein C2E44_21835 [Enterobacter ludwigii]|nr:hypothetical protein [Enterobacter sp. ABFQC]RBO19477.1 hypothetical protein C2E44_21835 [Enterobacter ludwigii]